MDTLRSKVEYRIMDSDGMDITDTDQGRIIIGEMNAMVQAMGLNQFASGRFSRLFVLEVYGGSKAGTVDPFKVATEIRALELGNTTGTKAPIQNRYPPLKGLWHKHYLENGRRAVALNVRRVLKTLGSPAIKQKVEEAKASGEDRYFTEADLKLFVDDVVYGNYDRLRKANNLAGEWIMFAKHEGQNYYLSLATHDKATHDNVRRNIEAVCYEEFPFLKGILEN